jgi:hypothetical protein
MLLLRSTYVVCNFLMKKSYCNHEAMFKNNIGNYFERAQHANECLINLMNLFMCQKFPSCMIQIFVPLNFLLVIATTMKEEVLSTLFMLPVMI